MTEKQLQSAIVKLAKLTGYLSYHTHDSRRSPAGFPDLVLVHEKTGFLIFIECKSGKGVRSADQQRWADALVNSKAKYYTIRPCHWADGTVESFLKLGSVKVL